MSNRLVVCPYDEAHKVKESRIQLHITKCRLNHPTSETIMCQFNATHVYPKQEHVFHLSRCPDRAVLDRMISAPLMNQNPFKGRIAVPSYSEPILAESDEVWDIEEPNRDKSLPTKEAPLGAIIQPTPMSKPASRRQLYQELHQMPSEWNKQSNSSYVPPPVPRQPKQPSQAERNFEEQGANIQHLGLGRGKPPASRIAANIFSQPSEVRNTVPAQENYSSVTTGVKNISLGRGTANRAQASPPILNDDDFPALGLGRGAPKNPPRQGSKFSGSRW